jgi:hypothetical protein
MRLFQQSLVRKLRHLIANRSRAHPSTMLEPRNRPRPNRLTRLDIALNNGHEDGSLPRRYMLRVRHPSSPFRNCVKSIALVKPPKR